MILQFTRDTLSQMLRATCLHQLYHACRDRTLNPRRRRARRCANHYTIGVPIHLPTNLPFQICTPISSIYPPPYYTYPITVTNLHLVLLSSAPSHRRSRIQMFAKRISLFFFPSRCLGFLRKQQSGNDAPVLR